MTEAKYHLQLVHCCILCVYVNHFYEILVSKAQHNMGGQIKSKKKESFREP
jgi:hypothetical protein